MNSEMLVDPTRPLDRQGVLSGDEELGADQFRFLEKKYTVDSILIKPNIKIAVVNAKRVGLGDTIDGASVVAIERGQVTLEVSGERRVIQLRQDVIKTNARK